MKNYRYITSRLRGYVATLALTALTFATVSCSSGFLKEYSQDLSRVRSAEDLNELLMGDCILPLSLFEDFHGIYEVSNHNFMVLHFMGDELQENISTDRSPDILYATQRYFPYFTWQENCWIDYQGNASQESFETSFWNLAYEKINNCNMVIDAEDDVDAATDDDKLLLKHVMGECHFLRAFYYLTLANLYGKPYAPSTASTELAVPIKTTSYIEDKEYRRNTVAEVYDQILADLNEAERCLDDVSIPRTIYHVGLPSVYILHSRVALYMQDWETARQYAQLALQSKSDLRDLSQWNASTTGYPINSDNPEVLYSNGASCFGNYVFPRPQTTSSSYSSYSTSPIFTVDDHLVALYVDNDGRKFAYITNQDDVTNHQWSYHKIDNSKASYGKYKTVSDVFSIRTAEAYLNLAEAEAHLGNAEEACRYLNQLRAARIAGVENVTLSGAELVQFIREERERELCFEGHRWFDLRRYMVDEQYPYTKEIVHTFSSYTYVRRIYHRAITSYYRLEQGDDAYTLNLPKSVRDFQNSIGSNSRPSRQAFRVVDDSQGS
jgi:hypothetical protein